MNQVLTPEMEKYFLENAFKESIKVMRLKFGVSDSVVKRVFNKNNIVVPKEIIKKFHAEGLKKPYTSKEDEYIIENISTKTQKEIAFDLGRSSTTVNRRCKELGLQSIIDKKIQETYIKKGMIPPNKGKKQAEYMSSEAIEKCRKTQFKKGYVPPNTKYFGKPYLYIRKTDEKVEKSWIITVNTKRVSYLKHLCIINNIDLTGKIPRLKESYSFSQIPTIDDIEVISFKENMNRNTIHRYPKELKQNLRLINKLKKVIKNGANT